MWYCAVDCQRDDWQDLHKYECAIIRGLMKINLEISCAIHTLIRLCIKYKFRKDILQKTWTIYDGSTRMLRDLISVPPHSWNSKLAQVTEYLNEFGINVHEDSVKYRAGQVIINSMGITNDMWFLKREDPMIGGGLYVELSALDNSCNPNAICTFNGSVATVRAIRDIDTEKEKVTLCYLEGMLMRPGELRRTQIKTFCQFNCKCQVCKNPKSMDDARNEFTKLSVPLFRAITNEKVDEVYKIFNRKFELIQHVLGGRYNKTWIEFMILFMEFRCAQIRKLHQSASSTGSKTKEADGKVWNDLLLCLRKTHGTDHPLYEVCLQFGNVISPEAATS